MRDCGKSLHDFGCHVTSAWIACATLLRATEDAGFDLVSPPHRQFRVAEGSGSSLEMLGLGAKVKPVLLHPSWEIKAALRREVI